MIRKTARPGRIKLGFCLDSFRIGGTELNAVRTVEALDRERFDISVFYLADDGPLKARYLQNGHRMHHFRIRSLYGPSSLRQRFRFAALLRNNGIQIVHTHCPYTNLFMAPVARAASNCSVISSRRWGRKVFGRTMSVANRIAYRFSHKVIANSRTVATVLADEDHVPRRKIAVIPNFLDDSAFGSFAPDWVLEKRADWCLPPDAVVVGIVARLEAVKNHRMLLQAVAMLDDNIHVVIVGDGSLRSDLEEAVERLGITSRVRFTGQIEMSANIHKAFDISVLCSISEGFPNTVIEAMAAARPVVATAVGGVVDAVQHNETGLLVPPDDRSQLADAIERLSSNPGLRRQMGQAGQRAASQRFSLRRVISDLEFLYEDLAQRRPLDGGGDRV